MFPAPELGSGSGESTSSNSAETSSTLVPWQIEMAGLEAALAAGKFSREDPVTGKVTRTWVRLRSLRENQRKRERNEQKLPALLAEEAALESTGSPADFAAHQAAKEKRRSGVAQERTMVDRIDLYGDDDRAFHRDHPLLNWDRRPYEPLPASSNDFLSSHPFALIDFQPRHIPAGHPHFLTETLLSHLYTQPSAPIAKVLDTIAPSASDWVVPRVPELSDPSKGGRRNLEEMRVRMLTPEMVSKIVRVWKEWPFAPSEAELLS
jgi:transcription factor 1